MEQLSAESVARVVTADSVTVPHWLWLSGLKVNPGPGKRLELVRVGFTSATWRIVPRLYTRA